MPPLRLVVLFPFLPPAPPPRRPREGEGSSCSSSSVLCHPRSRSLGARTPFDVTEEHGRRSS